MMRVSQVVAAAVLAYALVLPLCAGADATKHSVESTVGADSDVTLPGRKLQEMVTVPVPGLTHMKVPVKRVVRSPDGGGSCNVWIINLCRQRKTSQAAIFYYTTAGGPVEGFRKQGWETKGWWSIPYGTAIKFTKFHTTDMNNNPVTPSVLYRGNAEVIPGAYNLVTVLECASLTKSQFHFFQPIDPGAGPLWGYDTAKKTMVPGISCGLIGGEFTAGFQGLKKCGVYTITGKC